MSAPKTPGRKGPKSPPAHLSPNAFLRDHKFRIHSREPCCEPVWERNGRLYNESMALRIAAEEREALLRQLETQ